MDRQYQDLAIRELGTGAGFHRPQQLQSARVTLESPALDVMTDLARVSPATIRPQAPLEGANHFMISRGVRLLLVVDVRDTVLGVLTATDVLGEKALRVATDASARESVRRLPRGGPDGETGTDRQDEHPRGDCPGTAGAGRRRL